MNNLMLGLAVLGGFLLAGVVAHSTWTQRRNAPRVAQAEPQLSSAADAAARSEPGFDGDALQRQLDAKLGGDLDASVLPFGSQWLLDKKPALDALIDAMAQISLDEPSSGEAALVVLPSTRRVGSKSFSIEGLNLQAQWESPRPGERYTAFQAGVQLASRSGALNEIEFSEFVQKVQTFADAIGGTAEFPEMHDEVLRARELDLFASSHDAQLGFTLRAKNVAWSTGYVQQHAARLGFVAGAMAGRMVLPASISGMPPILSLNFDTQAALSDDPDQSALRSVDLALDVPQVDRGEQPYPRLRDVAIAMAASMDGQITDTQGRIITRDAMDAIGAELEQLYDMLESRDLASGSAQARRLFS